MRILNIKLSLMRDNNIEGIQVIEKVLKCAKKYNISINKAVTYLLSNYLTLYLKRILDICRAVYPYDGEIDINKFIKSLNNINNDDFLFKSVYKIGNFKESSMRVKHIEDKDAIKNTIGILALSTLKNNINKYGDIILELINPELIIQQKKISKKRKKRID